jgi:hypothetical protein
LLLLLLLLQLVSGGDDVFAKSDAGCLGFVARARQAAVWNGGGREGVAVVAERDRSERKVDRDRHSTAIILDGETSTSEQPSRKTTGARGRRRESVLVLYLSCYFRRKIRFSNVLKSRCRENKQR